MNTQHTNLVAKAKAVVVVVVAAVAAAAAVAAGAALVWVVWVYAPPLVVGVWEWVAGEEGFGRLLRLVLWSGVWITAAVIPLAVVGFGLGMAMATVQWAWLWASEEVRSAWGA